MSYGISGSAVGMAMALYRRTYPTATDEELKRGAEWMIRLSVDSDRLARHEEMPMEDQFKEQERQMFGPGDHSAKRATPLAGA